MENFIENIINAIQGIFEDISLPSAAKIVTFAAVISSFFTLLGNLDRPVFVDTYPKTVVNNLWVTYKDKIQVDGRTLDRDRNYITTSEGQSYALLRAVWMDDKETFDRVLKWTNNNLGKRDDDLFAWKWGKRANGEWDVIREEGGINSASDADQDIALALIFANKRWSQNHYLKQAKEILNDIWEEEVVVIYGRPYLLAGNWAKDDKSYTINPSYFMFYAYPIFAEVDPTHDWMALKATSYEVLEKATTASIEQRTSGNLPPDWISIDPITLRVVPSRHQDKKTDFADDAFRIPWRVGLDWAWHQDERARNYLLTSLDPLTKEWQERGILYSSYTHDGTPLRLTESVSMYAATYSYFRLAHPEIAEEIYQKKLAPLYDPDTEDFAKPLGYYAQNWVWFGLAFHAGELSNLYTDIQ